MKKQKKTERFEFVLTKEDKRKLRNRAKLRGITASELLRNLINN